MCISQNKHNVLPVIEYADTELERFINHDGMTFVLYCIVLHCIMRPYTDGPIGPLSYRHSSGVVRNPHSTLAE